MINNTMPFFFPFSFSFKYIIEVILVYTKVQLVTIEDISDFKRGPIIDNWGHFWPSKALPHSLAIIIKKHNIIAKWTSKKNHLHLISL